MPEFIATIKSYLAFTKTFNIDRSQVKYPELFPVCKELGMTYEELITYIEEN